MGSIQCPVCLIPGYLVRDGKYYKIAHNVRNKDNKRWTVVKHHLGNLKKTIIEFEIISEKRPDVIPSNIINDLKNRLKDASNLRKPIPQDDQLQNLIRVVFALSLALGKGWKQLYSKGDRHWVSADCPHCNEKITAFFMRYRNKYFLKLDKLIQK